MATSREHFALDWIKGELLETLNTARSGLEAFAQTLEDGGAADSAEAGDALRNCVNGLHQVHGTLVMLELKGVSLLADHLERVAEHMMNGDVADVPGACQSLMQGILELPGYLDELQSGLPDTDAAMVPLVNELRGYVGEPPLERQRGVRLFGTADEVAVKRFQSIDGVDKARKIRAVYQQVLLSVLKGGDLQRAVETLRKVAHGLVRICEGTPFAAQWQAFGEFVETLATGAGDTGASTLNSAAVKLLRRVDSEIRELAHSGAATLQRPISITLVRQLLEAAAERGRSGALLDELRDAAAQGDQSDSLSFSGRQALVSAATALREELGNIKDRLDLFARSSGAAGQLSELIPPLKQIGSTLSLLGFESSRSVVLDQVDALSSLVDSGSADESVILNIAGALVQVDDNLASLTQSGKGEVEKITDEAQRAVARQTRDGLDRVKQSIVDYVSSQWDVRHLQQTPDELAAITGALTMIPLTQAAEMVERSRNYLRLELMAGHVPTWEELDRLADALSGIDYYLERLASDNPAGAEDVLELVQRSLDGLASTAPDQAPAATDEAPAATDEAPAATDEAPAATDEAPAATDEAPAATDEEPAATDEEPAATHKAPAATYGEPAATYEEPAATYKEPAESHDQPDLQADADLSSTPAAAPAEEPLFGAAEDVDVSALGEAGDEAEPELNLETEEDFDLGSSMFDDISVSEHAVPDQQSRESNEEPNEEPDDQHDQAARYDDAPPPAGAAEGEWDLELEELEDADEPAASADALGDALDQLAGEAAERSAAGAVTVTDQPAAPTAPEHPAVGASSLPPGLADSFESDDEIVEIFAEEVDEVVESVDQHLAPWGSALADEEHLSEIRRAFHTLKGSGRMVGANVLGEMAWSVENMLNRVLDGTVTPTTEFVDVARQARELAPALKSAFERKTAPDMEPVGRIIEQADVLASGGTLADAEDEAPDGAAADDDDSQLFMDEAESHLASLRAGCAGEGFVLNDETMRALHTLSGSAAMAGLPAVGELAAPAYELAQALREPVGITRLEGESADFFRRATDTIEGMLSDIKAGREPEDQFQLVADADRLLVVAASESAPSSALLGLPAVSALGKAGDLLDVWRDGTMDMTWSDEVREALADVERVAKTEGLTPIAALAGALLGAHERFEFEPLDDPAFEVFKAGHERLFAQFDTLAADQELADAAEVRQALDALQPPPPAPEYDSVRAPAADEPEVAYSDLLEEEAVAPPAGEPAEDFVLDIDAGDLDAEDLDAREVEPFGLEAGGVEEASGAREPEPDSHTVRGADADEVDESAALVAAPAAEDDHLLPEEVDEDIIAVFFEEADEILESLDQATNDWSAEPDNRLHLENLLRGLHTLKGGARLSGLKQLGDQTHEFESYLIEFQESARAAEPELFSHLHAWHDEAAALLARIKSALAGAATEPPAVPESPAAHAPEAPAEPEPAAPDTPAAAPGAETAPPDNVSPLRRPERVSEPQAEARPEAAAAAQPRTAQEMVRVGAGLLESLVNLAGESSIIRARVEQGMSDFTGALDEMEITIERLREQLRRLEIETEAQILFRQDRPEGPAYEDFDPLEMDRYSQLQQLSRSLGESASDMLDLKETLLYKAREAETLLLQQARVNTELQEGLMRSRMVPFSRLVPRLKRTVRQVAKELAKDVELHAFNVEGELDRTLLERMVPPLEHMLRNAVDHGIEKPEDRRVNGKAESGRIDLRLSREGGDVVIEISDDGAGIDVERVRAKAVERGLMAADARLADAEISQFVLAPGFSTAASVTQISGRGVGMDVVHSEVKQLGGSIDIHSERGRGTRFVLRVPFTVSVNRALMVAVGDDLYAIPLNTIEGIVLLAPDELGRLYAPDGNTFEYAGVPYRVQYLGAFLGREYHAQPRQSSVPVVLVRSGEHAVAVHVDSVQGSREIVVKSLGPQFAGVGGISGATILGDGSVVVILDLLALIRSQHAAGASFGRRGRAGAGRTRCVMVVDDSVTVRKVTSRLLERQGMDVVVAKDGVEAVSLLQERRPDVMLLDIEMPRMDGFEVLRQVRHDERLADLPVVMISSRTGTKHQDRAAELGVNRFLGKPFQESELLATIDELVSSS